MKHSNKKAFTIVELVIVIAVVAVLAAVLIPTFSSLIKKANNSADLQLVTNLNKYLATAEVTDGKNTTMTEAMKDAQEAGYTAAALIGADSDIVWDAESDRFFAVSSKGKVIAKAEGTKFNSKEKGKYWIVSESIDQNYATYYVGSEGKDAEHVLSLTGALNFDGGEQLLYVTFNSETENVVLYGYFHTLTVTDGSKLPVVHGYVYTLVGNTKADGTEFHQSYDDIGNKVSYNDGAANATFGVCRDDDADEKCDFCAADMCKHEFVVTDSEEAGCLNKGFTNRACSKCGKTQYEVFPALGHDWQTLKGFDATCTTMGQAEGRVCKRCNLKEGGETTPPLFHDYDEDGKCQRTGCDAYLPHMEASIVNVSSLADIDWRGQNKATDVITIRLTGDITCTPREFIEAFGTSKVPFWAYDDGEVGGTEETENGIMTVYAIDLDLNGFTLTINAEADSDPVYVNGHLRIRRGATQTGKLVLSGQPATLAMFVPMQENATVTFKTIEVDSEYAPVYLNLVSNTTLHVYNSTLRIPAFIETTTIVGFNIFKVKCYDENETEKELQNSYRLKKVDGQYVAVSGENTIGVVHLFVEAYVNGKTQDVEVSTDYIQECGQKYGSGDTGEYTIYNGYLNRYIWDPTEIEDIEGNKLTFADERDENDLVWYRFFDVGDTLEGCIIVNSAINP